MSLISDGGDDPVEFFVDSNFQKMARRPGGANRDEALKAAAAGVERIKESAADWLDTEINEFLKLLPEDTTSRGRDTGWIDASLPHLQRLADVGATLDYPLMSLVANNLRQILAAIRQGARYHDEVVSCHMRALLLSRQDRYRRMQPDHVPELSEGLNRVLNSARSSPHRT